jgi:CDP-diacylglycerol--glycerol-3-phosphate 3-phosphatidyltransferase
MLTRRLQDWIRANARRFVLAIHLSGVTPNAITLMGLAVTAVSAVLIGFGWLFAGGLVLLFAGLFDILDGAVARATGRVNNYGAFLDSTTDRYAEVFTYIGLLVYFVLNGHQKLEPILVIASLSGSLLVSYARARAQSLGFTCEGGLLARPERVIIAVIGLVIAPVLTPALWVLAVLTNITALQRVLIVWRQARAITAAEKIAAAADPAVSVARPVRGPGRVSPEHR